MWEDAVGSGLHGPRSTYESFRNLENHIGSLRPHIWAGHVWELSYAQLHREIVRRTARDLLREGAFTLEENDPHLTLLEKVSDTRGLLLARSPYESKFVPFSPFLVLCQTIKAS
jgi:hypothetical protein